MLIELSVQNLGVVERLVLRPGAHMTVVSGETGAGKTLVVGAIALLCGGRAEGSMVRPGAAEAVVDGRFEVDGTEVVLSRVIPASGRSRAYRNGRPVTVGELAELGAALVEIHGQHDHQRLLTAPAQRAALDAFAGSDVQRLREVEARVRELSAQLGELGGDERQRARQADLVAFQLDELTRADLNDAGEDDALRTLEATLGAAGELRAAGNAAVEELGGEGGSRDRLGAARAQLVDHEIFADAAVRLDALIIEVDELLGDLRARTEELVDDPERLAGVQQRRRHLTELRRKYGATLAEVIAERDRLAGEAASLAGADERLGVLSAELAEACRDCEALARRVGGQRRSAAPELAAAVAAHLPELGLAKAQVEVAVAEPDEGASEGAKDSTDDEPDGLGAGSEQPVDGLAPGFWRRVTALAGERVTFQLAANPGVPTGPLAKVASGGELSRVMLALRLVLSGGPPVAVFDEVDAGVGGEMAIGVARSLAAVAADRQVLVVTHLAQVAAMAGTHVALAKEQRNGMSVTELTVLDDPAHRRVELARMLSGSPDSPAALGHAEELLASLGGGPSH